MEFTYCAPGDSISLPGPAGLCLIIYLPCMLGQPGQQRGHKEEGLIHQNMLQ